MALILLTFFAGWRAHAGPPAVPVSGTVTDTSGRPIAGATLQFSSPDGPPRRARSDAVGRFALPALPAGTYRLAVTAANHRPLVQSVSVAAAGSDFQIRLQPILSQTVVVTADLSGGDILSPDAAMKVYASEDLLDANPGRPGAPISIPGYPIETASSGIKAPQYFAPGVAGDHGEPMAMFIQVGACLVPNNLSANAHGNGYTDPNIFIADVIESVQIDGGAFNVREGNHALNLSATYGLRSHLDPFLTLVGDRRDLTATGGISPGSHSWLAMEGSWGNGFMDRLEHRRQFKLNGGQSWRPPRHTVTLFGIAYYGVGYVAGLSPIYGFNSVDAATGFVQYPDTIDPRQKDQTHTALLAANDVWKLGSHQELQFSGFFRTYNLALFSDFGLGLIRQSEFRTVAGASAAYLNRLSKTFTLLAGTDYEREAPRRDDLDHYNFFNPADPSAYGPFLRIMGANVTIAPVTPYIAAEGDFGRRLRYYLGWRQDQVWIDQQNLMAPANSWSKWVPVENPRATVTWLPGASRFAPKISASFGKSFFTEDPRPGNSFNGPGSMSPVERARSYQLVANRTFRQTGLRLTLGHETQNAEYGKVDSDQGLMFPLGPGRIRYLAATVRQGFAAGSLQATFEQADARLTNTSSSTNNPADGPTAFSIIPEAPRLIADLLGTYRKLPLRLEARSEFEYVGRKVVGNGCSEADFFSGDPNALNRYCLGAPNREFRIALARPFLQDRLSLGLNAMWARGYTGQTTENFACATYPSSECPQIPGEPVPSSPVAVFRPGGVGLDPYSHTVYANPVNEVVGVRIPSYASVSLTWRFAKER